MAENVTVQQPSFCEGFACKIPSYASKNPITKGDLEWIFARNCEGTEQLPENIRNNSCSQRDCAEHEGYAKASRSFNRIWKERDSAQPINY